MGKGELTKAQIAALVWLYERGGSGAIQRGGYVLARGDIAPTIPATWRKLHMQGFVDHVASERGGNRWRLTPKGENEALAQTARFKPLGPPSRYPATLIAPEPESRASKPHSGAVTCPECGATIVPRKESPP